MSTTRRKAMIGISQLAIAAMMVSRTGAAGRSGSVAGNSDLELLASIAYDILPYAELPPELYVKAGQQILGLNDDEVAAGLRRLRDITHDAPWKDVGETERVAILSSLQDTPFFRVIRANTVQVLLREPATFAIVGYGGPSIQYGGYLNRGFNDIDWLPASKNR